MIRIIAHGGAGNIADEYKQKYADGIRQATKIGYNMLSKGSSALDTVEEVVKALEDNPTFNAGKGSVLTFDGTVEMDAMIMDGKSLRIGGVMGLENFLHPISVSRAILEHDNHIFYAGPGAIAIAKKYGFQPVPIEELITPRSLERLSKFKENKNQNTQTFDPERREKYGTVGAVALDKYGNLASATSTGGILGKIPGRIGDTPIPGAGTYSDSEIAVSATGTGEFIIRSMLGYRIKSYYEKLADVNQATKQSLIDMYSLIGGKAGVIVLDKNGNCTGLHSTRDLAFAYNEGEKIIDFTEQNSFVNV